MKTSGERKRELPPVCSTDSQSVGQAVVSTAAFGNSGRDDRQPHKLQVCATSRNARTVLTA